MEKLKGVVVVIVCVVVAALVILWAAGRPGDHGAYEFAKVIQAGASAVAVCLAGFALWVSANNKQIAEGAATVSAWNIAHARLGALYDMAIDDAELREILNEKEETARPSPRSARQLQWASNVLIALEQATVASSRMDPVSRDKWCLYVINRARMPTFRALMLAAELRDGRDRESTWRSDHRVCALALRSLASFPGHSMSDEARRRLSEIDRAVIQGESASSARSSRIMQGDIFSADWYLKPKDHYIDLLKRASAEFGFGAAPATPRPLSGALTSQRLVAGDITHEAALRKLYADHGAHLLPLPDSWQRIVENSTRHVVLLDGELIGTFHVYECFGQATLGLLIHPAYRRRGVGLQIGAWALEIARANRWTFVYADVYDDNLETIAMMKALGLRPFVWYGAPLDTVEPLLKAKLAAT